MSDFSDDEDGLQEESRPGTQTGCVQDSSCDETLYWCDRPVANTVTAKLCDKPADNMETICVNNNDIMNSVSDDRDLDIANMSDFSDVENGIQVESGPRTQTGCVQDSSFNETLSWCDRPVTITVTAKDDRDPLDPNDREYWTKFRLLTKQAFLLDGDCLSDSNFPEAVKDVEKRSRLTMMALDEYDAPPFDRGG